MDVFGLREAMACLSNLILFRIQAAERWERLPSEKYFLMVAANLSADSAHLSAASVAFLIESSISIPSDRSITSSVLPEVRAAPGLASCNTPGRRIRARERRHRARGPPSWDGRMAPVRARRRPASAGRD